MTMLIGSLGLGGQGLLRLTPTSLQLLHSRLRVFVKQMRCWPCVFVYSRAMVEPEGMSWSSPAVLVRGCSCPVAWLGCLSAHEDALPDLYLI